MIISALTPQERLHLGYPPEPKRSDPEATWPAEVGGITNFDVFREKVRVAALAGRLQLLPWLDYHTKETPEIRATYRQMLKAAVVKAALLGKVFGVGSLELTMNPCADSDRDRKVAEICREAILDCSGGLPKIAMTTLLPALLDGHSISEKLLEVAEQGPRQGLAVYKALKGKDTEDGPAVKLVTDEFANVVGVRAFGLGQYEILPPEKFVIVQYLSLFESPTGMSDLRAVYAPYWRLDTVRKLRIIHLEKYTSPLLKGTYPSGDYESKSAVERAMQQAKAGTWFSIPEGLLIEAMQISMRGEAEFATAEKDYTEEIALAISGAFLHMLTGRGDGGMRGNSNTQKGTAELFVWYLAALLAQVITEQMVPDLVRYNFAPGTGRPTATLGDVNDSELMKSAQLDGQLLENGMALSKKERMRYYGRSAPVDASDTLVKQQPPKQPPPPPPGGGGAPPFGPDGGGGPQRFAEGEPHGGEFAKGGGRVPGKGGEKKPLKTRGPGPSAQRAQKKLRAARDHQEKAAAYAGELPRWHATAAGNAGPEGLHPHVQAHLAEAEAHARAGRYGAAKKSSRQAWNRAVAVGHSVDVHRFLSAAEGASVKAMEHHKEAERLLISAYRERKALLKKTGKYRFAEGEPHGGEFAKGGGRVPGKGGGGEKPGGGRKGPLEREARAGRLREREVREREIRARLKPEHVALAKETITEMGGAEFGRFGAQQSVLIRPLLLRLEEKGLSIPAAYKLLDRLVFVGDIAEHRTGGGFLEPLKVSYSLTAEEARKRPGSPQFADAQSFDDRKGGQFAPGGGRVPGGPDEPRKDRRASRRQDRADAGGPSHTPSASRGQAVPGTRGTATTPSKHTALTARLQDPARRRRALAGLKREAELAKAIGGVQLPDSEPADVVYAEDALGKRAETHEQVKAILRGRELAVNTLRDRNASPERKADAERVLAAPLHFLEVKTLLTAKGHAVHMSGKARARKERWQNRYGAGFSVVAVDDRRGQKHSGHRVHVSPGELAGTHHLKHMMKANDMAHVLGLIRGAA